MGLLGFPAEGDHAAPKIPGALRHFANAVGQEPTGHRLHGCQRQPLLQQGLSHRLLRRFVIMAPYVGSQPLVDSLFHRPNHLSRFGFVWGPGYNPQVDTVGLGVNTQIWVFLAEKFGNYFIYGSFRHAQGFDVARNGNFFIDQFPQLGRHLLLPYRVHLAGRARHADDNFALLFNPPPGRSAITVADETG